MRNVTRISLAKTIKTLRELVGFDHHVTYKAQSFTDSSVYVLEIWNCPDHKKDLVRETLINIVKLGECGREYFKDTSCFRIDFDPKV